MARKTKTQETTTAVALRPPSDLAMFDGIFDPDATLGALREGGGIAPFLSLEDGVISDGKNEVGDSLDVVITGVAVEHALYPKAYVQGQRQDPICFYVGATDRDAAPDPKSPEPQAASCAGCAKNAFGSAPNGRGKACLQRRRLLVLAYGEGDAPNAAPLRRLRVPPTSTNNLDQYARLVKASRRPLQSVVTTLTVVEGGRNKFELHFQPAREINDRATLEEIARRYETGKDALLEAWEPKAGAAQPEQPESRAGVRRVVKR